MREVRHDFGFKLEGDLPQLIDMLEDAIEKKEFTDCICEEIRTEAHCLYEDERADVLIDYYYHYRWDNYGDDRKE